MNPRLTLQGIGTKAQRFEAMFSPVDVGAFILAGRWPLWETETRHNGAVTIRRKLNHNNTTFYQRPENIGF